MKFKTKFSPKQFFSFKGARYQAQDGFFQTDDPKLIDFLTDHFAWESEKIKDNRIEIKKAKAALRVQKEAEVAAKKLNQNQGKTNVS